MNELDKNINVYLFIKQKHMIMPFDNTDIYVEGVHVEDDDIDRKYRVHPNIYGSKAFVAYNQSTNSCRLAIEGRKDLIIQRGNLRQIILQLREYR